MKVHGSFSAWFAFYKKSKEDKSNAEINAQTWINQLDDCIRLVQWSLNPEVFFYRLDMLIERASKLSAAHDAGYIKLNIDIGKMLPTDCEVEEQINKFIYRAYQKMRIDSKLLKSIGKERKKADAFFISIEAYNNKMSSLNIELLERLKSDYYVSIETQKLANLETSAVKSDKPAIDEIKERESYLDKNKIIDIHFYYNTKIESTYRQRDNPEYLEQCIEYCLKDIALFPEFEEAYIEYCRKWKKNYNKLDICIPSFERLAIIYEKQDRLEEAMSVCEAAIHYGLHDSTKGGFEARLDKLNKKLLKKE